MAKLSNYLPSSKNLIDPKTRKILKTATDPQDIALVQVVQALQRRLTFGENFSCEVKDISLRHNTEVEVRLTTLRTPILGVLCVYNDAYDYAIPTVRPVDIDRVGVKVYFVGTPAIEVMCRLIFLGA